MGYLRDDSPDPQRLRWVTGVPSSEAAAGIRGSIAFDEPFLHLCRDSGDWLRCGRFEEGTFTARFGGTTTNPSGTYASYTSRYVRIGDRVWCDAVLGISGATGGSGRLYVAGLPFPMSSTQSGGGTIGYCAGLTATDLCVSAIQAPGPVLMNGTGTFLDAAALSGAVDIVMSFSYQI